MRKKNGRRTERDAQGGRGEESWALQERDEKVKRVKRRELVVLLFMVLLGAGLIYRLFYIQIVKGEEYERMAYVGQTRQQLIQPKRGIIYDRNGKSLAISVSVDTVAVNPKQFAKEVAARPDLLATVSAKMAAALDMDAATISQMLVSDESFVYIKRKVEREVGDAVRAILKEEKVGSIFVDEDSRRVYPNGSLASQILGFTGTDDQGLLGLEMQLDEELKGKPGKILDAVDSRGNPIQYSDDNRVDAVDGYDVTLTIDETIQNLTEEALRKAVENANCKNGGTAIAMNPDTGEIYSIASYPDFDPNDPDAKPAGWTGTDAEWKGFADDADSKFLWSTVFRNKAVLDTYEPGSTFKTITAAAAIEEGIVNENTPVVCKPIAVADRTIYCSKREGHGAETFREGVYNSCNPVFVKVSEDLGLERFYRYVRMFGLQERTNIDLAGEPSDEAYRSLWHAKPTEVDMAVASFGQRFQVSPIQMITAYTAIANGGSLMKPILVREITDSEGNVVQKNDPTVVRKVISEQTSATIRSILEGVVSEGTGKNAYIAGYRMAGKTGTSETTTTDEGRYVTSFMSFAPADDPKVCLLIILDWPQVEKERISGGGLVAPTAGRLMEQILEYLQVERMYTERDVQELMQSAVIPKVTGMTVEDARTALGEMKLSAYLVAGETTDVEGRVVTRQFPPSPNVIPRKSTVYLYVGEDPKPEMTVVPDLTGRNIPMATEDLLGAGLNIKLSGTGKVASQKPAAGTQAEKGSVVEVVLTPEAAQ